jgi:uncharacterized surface protein with fasciclin (FAS1) repeats
MITVDEDGTVRIAGAAIVMTDIVASNGVIHVIDMVITPPAEEPGDIIDIASANADFETLTQAVTAAGLVETLQGEGPFTVFAPTDAAFEALPEGTLDALLADPQGALTDVLLYHVVADNLLAADVLEREMVTTVQGSDAMITVDEDGTPRIAGAAIVMTDIVASNGVIHVIDMVITPPPPPPADLVDVALADGNFTILAEALTAAGLVDTLRGEGPFTVFAPTDAAFEALPEGTLDALLEDPEGALTDVLLYHVAGENLMAGDVVAAEFIETLGGRAGIGFDAEGNPQIQGVNITMTDIMAPNGVIHVIDAVIIPPGDIVDIASNNEDFETLTAALGAAGLVETLQGEGPFTVFAPTDAAFEALGQETIDALLAEPEGALTDILLYHVAADDWPASRVVNWPSIRTVNGADARISFGEDGSVQIGGATIAVTNIVASNGLIHVIDTVIVPPEAPAQDIVDIATSNEDFETLSAALGAAGLVDTLRGEGPFTVFAPTDAAFEALGQETIDALLAEPQGDLTDILLYHVAAEELRAFDVFTAERVVTVQGAAAPVTRDEDGTLRIAGAAITVTDIQASNGVIHVIDTVITPPGDIVDIASNNEDFETLTAALGAAGLVETLQGEGPFTVFAPTDAAFEALGQETIDALLAEPEGDLTQILLYHVVPGRLRAEDVVQSTALDTAQGAKAFLTADEDGTLRIAGAAITVTDIEAKNGVIHVIDMVITPPTDSIVDIAVNDDRFETLVAALTAADLVETLQGEGPFTVFAPTDDAFAALGQETIDALLMQPDVLGNILLYHVTEGRLASDEVLAQESLPMVSGDAAPLSVDEDGTPRIDGAAIIITDIQASNGMIHVIDAVIQPPAN